MPKKEDPVIRFCRKVQKTDGCWLWTGTKDLKGYGNIWFQGRMRGAHRVVWELTHGPIPNGLLVCHNCPDGDNPSCVRPSHLFLGTYRDNNLDTVAKGRHTQHSQFPYGVRFKISDDEVYEIRRRRAAGEGTSKLAAEYHVSRTCIQRIVNGTRRANLQEGTVVA